MRSLPVLGLLTLRLTHLEKMIFAVECFTHSAKCRTFLCFVFKTTSAAPWIILFRSCPAGLKCAALWSDRSHTVHLHFLCQRCVLCAGNLTRTTDVSRVVKCQICLSASHLILSYATLQGIIINQLSKFTVVGFALQIRDARINGLWTLSPGLTVVQKLLIERGYFVPFVVLKGEGVSHFYCLFSLAHCSFLEFSTIPLAD